MEKDNVGYVIFNTKSNIYLIAGENFGPKLRSAIIFCDEMAANHTIWELDRQFSDIKDSFYKKENLVVKPVELKILPLVSDEQIKIVYDDFFEFFKERHPGTKIDEQGEILIKALIRANEEKKQSA